MKDPVVDRLLAMEQRPFVVKPTGHEYRPGYRSAILLDVDLNRRWLRVVPPAPWHPELEALSLPDAVDLADPRAAGANVVSQPAPRPRPRATPRPSGTEPGFTRGELIVFALICLPPLIILARLATL